MKTVFQGTGVWVAMAVAMPAGLMAQAPSLGKPTIQAAPSVQAAPPPEAAAAPPAMPPDVAELQRILNVQVATVADLDKRLADIDAFAVKFPDSQYRSYAFSQAGQAAQMRQDRNKAIFYYEQALAADPKDHMSMLMIAAETAQGTGEFDLKKEEKLGHAEKLVSDAMALIPNSVKPNPQIPDDQWAAIRKDDMAQAYEATGLIAMSRKKYDDAAKAFRMSIDTAANKQPATYVRLGAAYNEAKQYDEAVKILDEVIAMPTTPPQIKTVAESEKKRTAQLRAVK